MFFIFNNFVEASEEFISPRFFDFSRKNNFETNYYEITLANLTNFEVSLDNDFFVGLEEKIKNTPSWEYKVKKGDTLWSLSKKFKVKIEDLLLINNLSSEKDVKIGMKIKIPGLKPKIVERSISTKNYGFRGYISALASMKGFVVPVSGYSWGEKHGNNAVDIAAPCGEPVYSAQNGYVVVSQDGWNSGYGNYIIIYHENNVYTVYAHLSLRTVEEGEYVEKGDLIGYVGNTGYVKGLTGCHLHFEVRGSRNPFLD
ncbi:MAG: hypothetical protein C4347_01420 [Patescibacteria group bacterium]